MFDVFYVGTAPGLFAHETQCDSIEHACGLSRTRYFWFVHYLSDYTGWDWLWEPPPWQAHQRHAWPSQWQRDSGTYLVPKQGYIDTNYRQDRSIVRLSDFKHWIIPDYVNPDTFDFSWHPDPAEPLYRHIFPTLQHWSHGGGPIYRAEGADQDHYAFDQAASTRNQLNLWSIPEWIDAESIDRSWVPDPMDPPYIYEFPVEWGWDSIGGPQYRMPGAREIKYVHDWQARTRPDPANFLIKDRIAPDDPVMRWRPNPTEPAYIYIFGNQWHPAEVRESARYTVPGAMEFKFVDGIRCCRLPDASGFEFLYPADFDCSWEPDPGSPPYIYIFGNQYHSAEVMPTVRYAMPGATEEKFMDVQAQLRPDPAGPWQILQDCEWDYTWRPEPGSPAYIYVFGNQWWPAEKMPTVEYHMPGATERKYMSGPVARLPVDMTRWHIPPAVDIRDMDFSWVPDPGEPPYIYQFATQHQKTGGPQYLVPGAKEIKYLDMMRAVVTREAVPIVEIDHMDGNAGQIADTVKKIRYFDNYRDTLIRLARSLQGEHEHVWVCSSICDYTDFDFSWHPETWQSTMLHVFASDDQKFGDTFYMHVPTFADRAERKALLEWTSVNFVPRRAVPRRALPVVRHDADSHVEAVKAYLGSAPVTLFTNRDVGAKRWPAVNLWREETKTVIPLDAGAGTVIVPKAAVIHVREQIYDYPHIDKTKRNWLQGEPLDVVFISNGESNAEANWERLQEVLHQQRNRLHRVDGVDGRVAAYQAAAQASTTPWFFAVFAKLYVSDRFDWTWQPDRLQQAKHYIFHARNPVNSLEYGHQAMIAYNRRMTLENTGQGLDFTLDQPHEVVPISSGVARYADTAWSAWRTAFRECIKLRHSLPDVESQYRLDQWLTVGHGEHGVFSVMGAQDAMTYYDRVGGDFEQLRKTYEWSWLSSYAMIVRPQLFTQSST